MLRVLSVMTALLAATTAFAQTPAPSSTTSNLATITVTAPTGTPEAVDNTLAPVIVIDKQQLRSFGTASISSALRFHAGLDVAGSGGPGQPRSLFLRGAGSSEVQVRLDGIRIDPGTAGPPPFYHLLTTGVRRVEVVAAPRAALYGTDAIGGVISIYLDQPSRKGFDWGAHAGGGHYSSRQAGVHAGGGNGTFFGGGAFNWSETAGFPPLIGSDKPSAFRNQTIHMLAGGQNDTGEVYATLWRSTGTTDYLDFSANPVSQDYTDRVASLHAKGQLTNNWQSQLIVGQFFDSLDNPHSTDFLHTWRNSLDWRNNIQLNTHHLLTAGAYLAHEHVNASSLGSGYDTIERTRALYLQDQMQYGANRIVLAGREAHFTSFGSKFVWNANYGYRFTPHWRVTAGLGTGFRAPRATDLYGFGGNPNLKPEYSHSQNVALYWKPDRHMRFGLNLYRNHITDLITYEATSSGGQMQNIGSSTITGANLSARLAYGPWRIGPSINVQRPLNDDTEDYLPRRTRKSVTLNLGYDPGRWQLGVHILAKGETKDSDFSTRDNAGYVLTSLTAGFDLTPQWHIGARVENLFDVNHADAAGYQTAGRGLYLVIRYNM